MAILAIYLDLPEVYYHLSDRLCLNRHIRINYGEVWG